MFVELLPEVVGMMITPLAIVGAILLLESRRPVANAVAFGAAFGLLYAIVAVAVLIGGAAAGGNHSSGGTRTAGIVGLVVGVLFIVGGLVTWIRRPAQRHGTPKWIAKLEAATPRTAFLTGLGVALVNPNVMILLSGLTIIVAADVGTGARIGGAMLLVGASLLDFAAPIIVYLALGDRAQTMLGTAKTWTVAHTRLLTMAMLLVLGVVFTVRGIGKL